MDNLTYIPICSTPEKPCDYAECDLYHPAKLPSGEVVWADCCRTRGITDPTKIDEHLRNHPRIDRRK
jgi:hypothetical protein